MKKENIPPYASSLMQATRHVGYSLEAAVADLIDNSIVAQAKNVWVSFDEFPSAYIAIVDDGHGMTLKELKMQ